MSQIWKRVKKNLVYKGRSFNVFVDDILFPSGKQGKFEYLEKFPFVAVIARTNKNKIILVGQYRYTEKAYSWELIEGGVEKNESPLQAAKREFEEEAGLRAKKWKKVGKFIVGTGSFKQECFVFLAEDLHKGNQQPEHSGDIMKVKQVSISQLDKMIKQEKIFEGPTLAALYLAKDYLK